MSQANIPNITPTISITAGQTVPLLLASIALEELALAHVINSEAEKIQFVLGTLGSGITPPPITLSGLLTLNHSVQQTLQTAIKQEMLLQFKLENVLDLVNMPPVATSINADQSATPINIIQNEDEDEDEGEGEDHDFE